jgi:hypothetical protein
MSKGWVRVSRSSLTVFAQGKAPGLLSLTRHVHKNEPKIRSMRMDVHGASETYRHLDPSIQGMAHKLEREDFSDFIASGGGPHKRYTEIVRTSQK